MIDPAVAAPRLAPDQLDELQTLLGGADSVELKLTVPDGDQRSAIRALKMDPLEAEVRQVFFFDTPDLLLNQHGVIVRARRTLKGDDSIVKLRPVVPSELSADLRSNKGFGVEVDAMPGGFVCSGRMQAKMRAGKVKEALAGERTVKSLFDKKQRAFFADCAPDGISIDQLATLGPIFVMKLKFSPERLRRPARRRALALPGRLSHPGAVHQGRDADAFEVAARTRQFLEQHGIDLSGEQQTKTKTALEFFSAELR